MTLSFKAGTFTKQSSTGNQAVTGVGFQPKALILFSTATTTGSFQGDFMRYTGFASSSTTSKQRFFGSYSTDAADPSDAKVLVDTDGIWADGTPSSNFTQKATLSSFDSDGFTLNWSINNSTNYVIGYIALGGDDVTNTNVGSGTISSGTGNKSVTGVGFQPDLVILLFGDSSEFIGLGGWNTIGIFNSSGEQWSVSSETVDDVGTMQTNRKQRTDKCFTISFIDGDLLIEASFVSMDSDGFTLNFSSNPTGFDSFYIAIKGVTTKIGSITAPTAGATPTSQATTGVGFQPKGIIFSSFGNTATTSLTDHARYSFGAVSDSSNMWCGWSGDEDAAASAVTAKRMDTDQVIRVSDEAASAASTTTQALASLTSLDSDGFTLSWSAHDTTAYQVVYVAFQDTAGGGPAVETERVRRSTSMLRQLTTTRKKRYTNTSMV